MEGLNTNNRLLKEVHFRKKEIDPRGKYGIHE